MPTLRHTDWLAICHKAKAMRLGELTQGPPRPPRQRGMNKTEAAYADTLRIMQAHGLIRSWAFEAIKLRLTEPAGEEDTGRASCWYTPDFFVVHSDGRQQFVEIKGFERDDAILKFKIAAEVFPWARWTMLRKGKGGVWTTLRDFMESDRAIKEAEQHKGERT